MNEKHIYIWKLASFLTANGKIMSGGELVEHLNRNNIPANTGEPYKGGRGIYSSLDAAYAWVERVAGKTEAGHIADAFTNKDGSAPWQKRTDA